MTFFGRSKSPLAKAPVSSAGRRWRRFRKNIFVSFFIDLLVIVGTALVLSLLIKTFLIRSFFIPSGSMLETLQIDDRIIVNELVPNVIPIERGDVDACTTHGQRVHVRILDRVRLALAIGDAAVERPDAISRVVRVAEHSSSAVTVMPFAMMAKFSPFRSLRDLNLPLSIRSCRTKIVR